MRESTAAIVCRGDSGAAARDARTVSQTFGSLSGLETIAERLLESQQRSVWARDLIPHDACMENIMGFLPEKELSDKCRGAWFAAVMAVANVTVLLPAGAETIATFTR